MDNNEEEIVEIEYTEEDIKKKRKKMLKVGTIAGITLIVLIVATYAWFIGITTVSVEEFQVEVETLKGLQISFNGTDFSDSASISKNGQDDAYDSMGIANNHWIDDKGLVPISSSGRFSSTGHLNLYSNASINAITGGYRIRTEKILNEVGEQEPGFNENTSPEKGQYVTFDLFLKNTTNTQGTTPNDSSYTNAETEAVYLLVNSNVITKQADSNDVDTSDTAGMENSLRVGFYQVAYSRLDAAQGVLQTMGCENDSTNNTVGVCAASAVDANRTFTWNIWEPNDLYHKTNAISKVRRLCKNRTDATNYTSTECTPDGTNTFADGQSLTTYAVNKAFENSANVNVYDGINTYLGTSTAPNDYLKAVTTLKQSENVILENTQENPTNIYNTNRSPLIHLAPNSITKIRVYIWLEGQDLDNLDYMGDSKKLLINFGFTKDIYEEELPSPSASPTTPESNGD